MNFNNKNVLVWISYGLGMLDVAADAECLILGMEMHCVINQFYSVRNIH